MRRVLAVLVVAAGMAAATLTCAQTAPAETPIVIGTSYALPSAT